MQLDETHWQEALDRIGHEQILLGPRSAVERGGNPRDMPRRDRRLPCLLRVADDTGAVAIHRVMTRNSGRGGVSVLHSEAMDPGCGVTIAMQTENGCGFVAPATVAWSRRIGQVGETGEVCHEVGFRFAKPLRSAAA